MRYLACILLAVLVCATDIKPEPPKAKTPPKPVAANTFKHNIMSVYRISLPIPFTFNDRPGTASRVLGSGVAFDIKHLLVAAHMIVGIDDVLNQQFCIQMYDKDDECVECGAKVLRFDLENDLALLESEAPLPNFIKVTSPSPLDIGDELYAIGCRWGISPYDVRTGFLSCKNFSGLYLGSVSVQPGDSGGGMFNSNNELVGILKGTVGDPTFHDIAAFVPISKVKAFLEAK